MEINERLPYDKRNTIMKRTCSFIGSTNRIDFLNDETGSVRWLCFTISNINWNYLKEFDIENLWIQAAHLAKDINFNCEMEYSEICENEERNAKYEKISIERELIRKYFTTEREEFLDATSIMTYLAEKNTLKTSPEMIGRSLKAENFSREKYKGFYGYWLKKRE